MSREAHPPPGLFLAVALVSGSLLGFQVLLLRLFTLMYGHHFASMVISLALLGLGAGGSFLRLFRTRLQPRFSWSFFLSCVLFAASLPVCLSLAGRISFNPLQVVWDKGQWLSLSGLYLLFALPFFLGGTGIGLALTFGRYRISRIYAADLFGAAAGGGLMLGSLFLLTPVQALAVLSGCGLLAALSAGRVLFSGSRLLPPGGILLAAALLTAWPGLWPEPVPSEYKGLSRTLLLPEAEKIMERDTPFGRVSVVQSPRVPFRYAPGLSHRCSADLPEQLGLFVDGEMAGVINLGERGKVSPGATDCLPTAAAYRLLDSPKVLCNQAGQGLCILEGLQHSAASIAGVQDNPALVSLLKRTLGAGGAGLYHSPEVDLFSGTLRAFLAAQPGPYDLIRLWSPGGRGMSLRGQPLKEEFDFTTQAFRSYLDHLRDGGLILVSHWLSPLWSETFKLAATAREALLALGQSDPGPGMGLILSQSTALLLVKKGRFQAGQREGLEAFGEKLGFRVLFFDELQAGQKSDQKAGQDAGLRTGMQALLEKEGSRGFKFHVRPATDASPYFNRFFTWRSLPELWQLRTRGGGFLQWGYLVLILTLVQAVAAGTLLILLPVGLAGSGPGGGAGPGRLVYFTCLGLAFLFVEIGLMQKMTLLLGQPLLAVSLALVSILFFAGLGSSRSEKIGLFPAVAAISGLCLVYLLFLPALFAACLAWPLWARLAMGLAVSGLPAFFMGIPFPSGLSALQDSAPAWTPWAFAVNGCASVISPLLAVLICVHLGFAWLMGAAMLLYILALVVYPRLSAD
ncbi:MAG: hypothetical protein K9K64_00080 [Desulfohalobiaceae bacterium]|nr:hypothetical protein [Desulfohalobiaceae bacterium]